MFKTILMTVLLASAIQAQDFNPDFNPEANQIICSNGSDYHDSISIYINKAKNSVKMIEDGEDIGRFSGPIIEYLAADILLIRFRLLSTNEEMKMTVAFRNELAKATLNSSDFDFDCLSRNY